MRDTHEELLGVQAASVACTPSKFPPVASDDTLTSLEFPTALAAVAAYATSSPGRAAVSARRPSADLELLCDELATVEELAHVLRREDPFRPEPVQDVTLVLDAAQPDGAVIEGTALAAVGRSLVAMRLVAKQLDRLAPDAPRTARLRVAIPPRSLEREITETVDEDGQVPDGASREVDRARARIRDLRTRLHRLLERTLRGLDAHHAPGDATVTVRNGRFVIPVARDARGRVPGIIHDESSSGATLFVEPQRAVELANDLRAAEVEETRIIRAILRALTAQLRAHLPTVRDGWDMCVRVDDLYARARYAVETKGFAPQLVAAPGALRLRDARHPLLLAEGVDAVPFDLTLSEDELAVIVSGPNAGGKTVLLKAVGLTTALAQAGVIPPIGERSCIPVFRRVVVDIGDHQSIEANLSTFSAHVVALRTALEQAGPEALVLLDEVGSGTDPHEGAALAGAALMALVDAGTRTMATTHLTALKELATQSSGIVNASLEFDADKLAPTYRLLMGIPGRSYGLVIARRLGVSQSVLETAEQRVPKGERALDMLLAEVEQRIARVEERERRAEDERARLRKDVAASEQRAAELAGRERAAAHRETELEREGRGQARRFLLEARRRVEDALAVARATVSETTAKQARRLVEEGISREAEELRRLEDELRKKGWTVRGSVTDSATVVVPTEPPPPAVWRVPEDGAAVALGAASEIDVRGLMADEARDAVQRAIDAAVVAELPSLRIIHGKGTGRLRVVVAELAKRDARVRHHAIAPTHQGGTGVTIVEFGS